MNDSERLARGDGKLRRRQRRALRSWLLRVPLLVLIPTVGLVASAGGAGAAKPTFKQADGVVAVPSSQGILRGEDLGLQNLTFGTSNVRYENLDWQTLAPGQSRIYRTNRPDAKARLCFGTPVHPRVGECKPGVTILVDNRIGAFPSLSIGPRIFDETFAQGDSRSVTTTVGSQRLVFTVTRLKDDSVTRGPDAGFKIEWQVSYKEEGTI